MRFHILPADMTADERRHEVAAILARGVLRLQKRRLSASDSNSQEPSESGRNSLELPPPSRLSVTTG
jgi:hypothetical protein